MKMRRHMAILTLVLAGTFAVAQPVAAARMWTGDDPKGGTAQVTFLARAGLYRLRLDATNPHGVLPACYAYVATNSGKDGSVTVGEGSDTLRLRERLTGPVGGFTVIATCAWTVTLRRIGD